MNNHLTGFIISALLHAGLFGLAFNLEKETKKEPLPGNKVVLSVSMFQAKAISPPPPLEAITKPALNPVVKQNETPAPQKVNTLPVEPEKKQVSAPPPIPAIALLAEPKLTKPAISIEKKKPGKIKKATKIKKPRKKPHIKKVKKPVRKIVKKTATLKKVRKVQRTQKVSKKVPVKVQRRLRAPASPIKTTPAPKSAKSAISKHNRQLAVRQTTLQARAKLAPQARKSAPQSLPSTAARTIQINNLSKQYKVRLRQLIISQKRYPKRARRRGQQGKVSVSFNVSHSGTISHVRILKSSNSTDLNNASIKAIKQVSRKLPFFKGMPKKSLKLNITLSYILR